MNGFTMCFSSVFAHIQLSAVCSWMRSASKLGAGVGTSFLEQLTPEELGSAITKATTDEGIAACAKAVAAEMANEDGVATAVAVIQARLRKTVGRVPAPLQKALWKESTL